MKREDRLEFCQACKNQKFDMQKGVICSLTNEQATFEDSCLDYIEDPIAKEQNLQRKEQRRDMTIDDESFGLSTSFGVKNGILAGQIAIAVAIIWFIVGFFLLDRIFFYPFVLLVLGIIAWQKGLKRKDEEQNKSSEK